MLKLEKNKKGQEIAIRFKEEDRFFTKPLLQALVLALFIHLGGFILFHVQTFTLSTAFVFKPISVHTSLPGPASLDLYQDSKSLSYDKTLEPPDSLFNKYSIITFERPSFDQINAYDLPFFTADSVVSNSKDLKVEIPYVPINMFLSGSLAKRRLVKTIPQSLTDSHQISSIDSLKNYEIKFHVIVDPLTGKIFWFDKIKGSGIARVDKQVEKLLFDLQFDSNDSFDHTKGNLTFFLSLDKNRGDL